MKQDAAAICETSFSDLLRFLFMDTKQEKCNALSQGGVNAAKKDLSCLRLPPVTHLEERNIMTMHGDLNGETRRA